MSAFIVDGQICRIRPISETDSLSELTELLHRAYKVLADMGLRFMATHQSVEETGKRVKKGSCFIAEIDSAIIGTITYYPPSVVRGSPWLNRHDVALFGQLAVEPRLQRRGIASRLVDHVENVAHNDGAVELALDTAEPATHLIEWYAKLGYRFIEYVQWDVTNYRSVVMSKTVSAAK